MSDPQIKAAFYLSPTLDALWRWSEDGQVLTWADGTTIAFRREVEDIIRRLAPGGLPPFGAVALLLAACRDSWPTCQGRDTVVGYSGIFQKMAGGTANQAGWGSRLVAARMRKHMGDLIAGLDTVHALPKPLREKLPARLVLAETVFEGLENRTSIDDANLVVQAIEEGINPEMLRAQLSLEESLSQFSRQVDGLALGLSRVDPAALARRSKTGIDEEPKPPEEDLSPPLQVRRLLAALRDDPELGPLARLAQDLMAAVTIPRTLHAREELPAGGVSDLSNRGPLDRLLVSELAHDDLTLAVRVAVNEALYLRPESPPREPPHRRAVLVDVGIRMWGIPRLYAIAVALAMASTTDPNAEFAVYRTTPQGIEAIDVTTKTGIERLMSAMEAAPHPGGAIDTFCQRIRESEEEADANIDRVLVTHPDVLADGEFMAAFAPMRERLTYVATVSRDGAFNLTAYSKAGTKLVRLAKLELERILAPEPSKPQTPKTPLLNQDPRLPSIFFAKPFPLYLPHRANPRSSAISARYGLISVTSDGRLLHWKDATRGGRQLVPRLPRGLVRLVHIDDLLSTAQVVITSGYSRNAYLVTAELESGQSQVQSFELREPDPDHVFAREGVLYFVYRRAIHAHNLNDAHPLASMTSKKRIRWERGRFVRFDGGWCAIAYDGSQKLVLESLRIPPETLTLFDSAGRQGFCAVLTTGQIVTVPQTWSVTYPRQQQCRLEVLGVSPDGQRLVIRQGVETLLLQLRPNMPVQHYRVSQDFHEALLAPTIYASTQSYAVPRVHFKGIYVDRESRLSLISRKNDVFHLDLDHRDQLVLREDPGVREMPNVRRFTLPKQGPDSRLKLRTATWDDGSIAWLDPRGLLHLKSSDSTIPEMSVTLSAMPPAAWTTEGKVCGPRYFIGDQPATPGPHFAQVLKRFVGRVM